jgi:DNA-binding MarR family transcriptional regulator
MTDIVRTFGYLALGTRLRRLGERLQAETQKLIDGHAEVEIVASQFPYLAAVDRLGPLATGDLAQALGVTQPAVTRTVMQLVDAGLLTVAPAPDDQRRRIISLSAEGRRLIEHAAKVVWPEVEAAVRDLCGDMQGPLLDQLTAIENGLDEQPLHIRARRLARKEQQT